jgi:hypothetical protein
MRDANEPWRVGDLPYLEREINYWTVSRGYAACAAGVQRAQALAARHGIDRVMVLPGWAARYDGDLHAVVNGIDPTGQVIDCAGVEIVVLPTTDGLAVFMAWCAANVRWS